MPVTEIKEGTFLLEFEHEFVLNHDSLIALSQSLLPKTQFPSGYTVTVHDCSGNEIVYGFQINIITPDILACKGRIEPRGCYIIEFVFPDFYKATFDYSFITLVGSGILMLSTVALLFVRFGKSLPVQNQDNTLIKESVVAELTPLGKFLLI